MPAPDLLQLALRRRDAGDVLGALAALEVGMELFPMYVDGLGHPAFRKELIRVLLTMRQWDKAADLIPMQGESSGEHWPMVLFARAYSQVGDLRTATAWWNRVIHTDPGNREAYLWFKRESVAPSAPTPGAASVEPMRSTDHESRLAAVLEQRYLEAKGFIHNAEYSKTLAFFDAAQAEVGITGCTGEIGVYNGGFFVPIALCCRGDELAVAIDVFDHLEHNWNLRGGLASLARFKKIVIDTLGSDEHVRYIEGDSFHLRPEAVRAVTEGRGFRLFSIDGAHSVHHTVSDLKLIGELTNAGGIVILDDIKNWGWPGVIDGFARYMLLNDYQRLVPFFLYGNKLFLTTPSHQDFFLRKTVRLAKLYGRSPEADRGYRISDFFGFKVVGWN